ncbi:hypothetical protein D3OALGA1CA_998 [Olavius algarvensis associated proteobacterium Delta 3]|nr:hypothetical protein D3OALGA1CA_998 [Olavius algarvensis associated proteobacterium Delta 3]CAB5130400.1 hypothetical protein D3OALGB2SA_3587 [Olavius algarvensis associated proteobacterium Delta 3]
MTEAKKTRYPDCFGDLETVFPMGRNKLRNSPIACRACVFKTECLRDAMKGGDGLKVREEAVDRAYSSGRMTFFERWSKKKTLHRLQNRRRPPEAKK